MTTITKNIYPEDKARDEAHKEKVQWEITLLNEGTDAGYCEQANGTDKKIRARMQAMIDGCRKLLPQGQWSARADQVGTDMPNKRKIIL
jgi:hypothetical protein